MPANQSLDSLLEESRKLTTHLSAAEIPSVKRGLDLLEAESRKLVAKSVRDGRVALDPRGHSLLASSGVDTERLTDGKASAALLSAFELQQPEFDANVESFLSQQQEQSIISAIEEIELSTLDEFDRNLSAHMQQMWDDSQHRLFEELGQYQGTEALLSAPAVRESGSFELTEPRGSDCVVQPRVERYAKAVRKLNDSRANTTQPEPDVIKDLEQAASSSSKQMGQAWKLLNRYVSGRESLDIAAAACGYLEEAFIEHIDKVIAQYPHDANVGGVPSVNRKIQGYLNVQFGRLGRVPAFLEVFNDEAIWAHMYMLYRCGYQQELVRYAMDMEDIITDSDPGFVAHLRAFVDRSAAARSDNATALDDPYKAALYKVLGRGSVPKKAAAEVVQTTEDYLWTNLAVIRDADRIAAHPTLESLQSLMLKFGPAHFDPHGNNPLLYFRVLLLCGMFAHAVDYLVQIDQYQVEAVHIAIALAYYGLLQVPGSEQAAYAGYLVADSALDFSRMVIHYARALPAAATDDAIHYMMLLTMPALATSEGIKAQQQRVCEQAIVHILFERRDYAHYLGDIQSDGTRKRGFLERYMPLLGISSHSQFAQSIVCRLADRSLDEGRLADTVLLYNLAERYNTVLYVLSKQLGELLYAQGNGSVSTDSELEDIEGVSRAVLEHYKQREHIARSLDERAVSTCTLLLSIMDFLALHRQGAYEQALETIRNTQLLPLDGDISVAPQHAERIRTLDDAITRNFSLILLAAMDTLSRLYAGLKESPFLDAVKQANLQQLRKQARSLMVFAGMVQFRMPSDTYAKLNRMDVFMN
ncbi:nuclear pore complex subunit [Coemansia sp. RSA 989]|nr:nuclear pore complex subunit [Coemansia sp. RSA 989]